MRRSLVYLSVSLMITSSLSLWPAFACAPTFTFNVIFNDVRPNLPLSQYAGGNLGIVQPSYAKSYLCVAYRYLTNKPLADIEQKSIMRLWRKRLIEQSSYDPYKVYDCSQAYFDTRKKILGKKKPELVIGSTEEIYEYSFVDKITAGAFLKARARQMELVKRFGIKSKAVLDWQNAQDIVFSSAYDGKPRKLAPLADGTLAVLRQYRQYQRAALAFYQGDFTQAEKYFAALAADKTAGDSQMASYLAARCRANAVMAGSDCFERDATISYLEKLLKEHKDPEFRQNINELLMPLKYQYMGAAEVQRVAAQNVLNVGNERFGSDVGDLTYSLDEMETPSADKQSSENGSDKAGAAPGGASESGESSAAHVAAAEDLILWLRDMSAVSANTRWEDADKIKNAQKVGKERAEQALTQFRSKHTLPWLIAALSLNDLRLATNSDLFRAAENLPPSSPAYFTASYYVVDALAAGGHKERAITRLKSILKRSDVPAGSRNLFQAQMLSLANSTDEYLSMAFMQAEKRGGYSFVPEDWPKKEPQIHGQSYGQCAADEIADDLNIHLPLALWLKACRQGYLEPAYRARLTRSVWLRAHLLSRPDVYQALTNDMCRFYPALAALVRLSDSSSSSIAARYALAQICLRNFGMSPYIEGEEARHDLAVNQFDFYNENFWSPVSLKPRPKPTDNAEYGEFSDDLVYGVPLSRELPDYNNSVLPGINEANCRVGVGRLLNAREKAAAASEARKLSELPPAKVLGDAVFNRLKQNPSDESLSEMLYRVVKLAKWSPRTRIASEYSHKAHGLLRARFAASKWARQAPYWY